ncbi:MAG TPA: hypothetical protein VMQ56_05755 [Terracidiphilus sp.]|jgi:hypothetical protein|nr:hypothetical protein [Terracidiphilus sp.]
MSDAKGFGGNRPIEEASRTPLPDEPQPRAVGSPLPIGSGNLAALPNGLGGPQRAFAAQPAGRALAGSAAIAPRDAPSGVQRAISAVRAALPYVQRILPLLDGNVGTAVANFLTPHHHAPPPPPPVNLAPIADGLAALQTQHRELRDQIVEQNTGLNRVEDQLQRVHEATDRNTLEQQELMENLKVVGKKVNLVAIAALGLLAVSVIVNILLYLHIQRVLP